MSASRSRLSGLQPLYARTRDPLPLRTAVAIVATGIGLLVAALILDGLRIDGVVTLIAATFIVWLAAILATWILPFLGLKKFLDNRRD